MKRLYVRTFEGFKESLEYTAQKMFKDYVLILNEYFSETGKCTIEKIKLETINVSSTVGTDLCSSMSFECVNDDDTKSCVFTLLLPLNDLKDDKKDITWNSTGYVEQEYIKESKGTNTLEELNEDWIIENFIDNTNYEFNDTNS